MLKLGIVAITWAALTLPTGLGPIANVILLLTVE
jgi:hypothetical protein